MKIFDRFLIKELLKYTFLAFLSLATIYILIDFFEELPYFVQYRVKIPIILLYYFYTLPEVIGLLWSPAFMLAIFFVYGRAIKFKEIDALKSAGINLYRVFLPPLFLAIIFIFFLFLNQELVDIPFKIKLSQLTKSEIEKRTPQKSDERREVYYFSENNFIYFIKELKLDGLMKNFTISEVDLEFGLKKRYDGVIAEWNGKFWVGRQVFFYSFEKEREVFAYFDSFAFTFLKEKPEDLFAERISPELMDFISLASYIKKFKRVGYRMDKEAVNFHSRFSSPLIVFIVTILSLGVVAQLKREGVMLGLGLGLLFAFLYWGAIQIFRAMGEVYILPPFLSAWLPNFIFLSAGLGFFVQAK